VGLLSLSEFVAEYGETGLKIGITIVTCEATVTIVLS